jgi:hypothetical protein
MHDPTTNTLPSKVGVRIRYNIGRISKDNNNETELFWLTSIESGPILADFCFYEDIESET